MRTTTKFTRTRWGALLISGSVLLSCVTAEREGLERRVSAISVEGARGVKAVDLGENHGCAVLSDGGIVCWGSGLNGRLGTGSTANVENLNDAIRVSQLDGTSGRRAVALSTAFHHSCAVRSDGRVFCWGLNTNGQCGLDPANPLNADVLVATQVSGITNAVAVTTGDAHSCALLADSTVVCWGSDSSGQLGNGSGAGSSHVPAVVSTGTTNLDGVVAIEAEWSGTCALLSTGGLSCWGNTHQGPSFPTHQVATSVSGFANITSIAAGGSHVCGRRADGRVLCMGANGYGVLGQGHSSAVNGVVEVNGANTFASIFSGNYHTCGVKASGQTYCWGANTSGQLGLGHTNATMEPTVVPSLTHVVGGGGGQAQTCWLRANTESLACAGGNSQGQLGNGDSTHASQSTPVNVQLGEWLFVGGSPFGYWQNSEMAFTAGGVVDAGQCHVCALRNTFSWATYTTQREVICWGHNDQGQLGNSSAPAYSASPVIVTGIDEPVVALSAGGKHSCALTSGGRVWCWGANASGQLGIGSTNNANTPQLISSLTEVVQITTGQLHTCALRADGHAWCWGASSEGQLGRGTTSDSNVPVEVWISTNTPMENITSLSAGWGHTCAREADGDVRCWGEGSLSQNGSTTGKDLLIAGAQLVFPTGFRPIGLSAGQTHTCALSDDGEVACWGGNTSNMLALPAPASTLSTVTTPTALTSMTGAVSLQGGGSTICAVKSDGTAQCWGMNSSGTVGNGTSGGTVTTPSAVSGLGEVVSVTSDCNVSCAMLANGTVRCWGGDGNGQLGNGEPRTDSNTPVSVLGF